MGTQTSVSERSGVFGIFERPRTPAEPGPGTVSPASLRALDLVIARRLGGIIAGEYRSAFTGRGSELHQIRAYEAGDDVRRIDWNVTARTGEPHVRVDLDERVLVTWIVLDLTASMRFGTADRRKTDVAEGVSLAVAHLATRRGNRLGVVAFGDGPPRFQPPRPGRRGLLHALDTMRGSPAGPGSLDAALGVLEGAATQRAAIVVVSDFRGERDWRPRLLRLSARHRVFAVEPRDPREQELSDVGELRVEDPETGRQAVLDTSDPGLRERFAAAAAAEREELAGDLMSVGIPHLTLSTEGDWLRPLALFFARGDQSR